MKELRKKIWEVKTSLPVIKKETEGYNFKYVDIQEIEKHLLKAMSEKGLAFQHRMEVVGEAGTLANVLTTMVFDIDDPENYETSSVVVPEGVALKGMNPYQSLGSAITYFKRYNLVTLFDILGTDNDVDALTPESAPVSTPQEVDYVKKIEGLIEMGRKRKNLEKYVNEYWDRIPEDQRDKVLGLVKAVSE